MPRYEYKVVPAPQKGLKAKGVRSAEARFSNALETLMNAMSQDGWEYQRAETLPSIERSGLASSTTEWRNVLVFRRQQETATEAFAPELLPPPETRAEPPVTAVEPVSESDDTPDVTEVVDLTDSTEVVEVKSEAPEAPKEVDNGVEDTDTVDGIGESLEKLSAYRNSLKSDN